MKNVPDIAPEVRGLLEEIVANPRSTIRLAPRRALSTWFDTGETVRASDVSRTKAERHLVEAHREELAALLCEASWISYWKAPVLSPRPTGEDGELYHPTDREPGWRLSATRELAARASHADGADLLRQCLNGIKPNQGWSLAQASLALIPNDRTRCFIALGVQWTKPRIAITLYNRLINKAQPSGLRPCIVENIAAITARWGFLDQARELYRASAAAALAPYSRTCAFTLSCFLDDWTGAVEEAAELGKHFHARDPRIIEASDLLRGWCASRTEEERRRGQKTANRIADQIPEVARALYQAIQS